MAGEISFIWHFDKLQQDTVILWSIAHEKKAQQEALLGFFILDNYKTSITRVQATTSCELWANELWAAT